MTVAVIARRYRHSVPIWGFDFDKSFAPLGAKKDAEFAAITHNNQIAVDWMFVPIEECPIAEPIRRIIRGKPTWGFDAPEGFAPFDSKEDAEEALDYYIKKERVCLYLFVPGGPLYEG